MNLVAACLAAEACLSGPIAPFRMAALAAFLAGISWVFLDDLHASQSGFVPDEREELRKGPSMNHAVHLVGHLCAVADAEQLLDVQDATAGGYGVDDLSADAMVFAPDPSGFSPLTALDHAELALALQSLSVTKVPSSGKAQRFAVKELDDAGS